MFTHTHTHVRMYIHTYIHTYTHTHIGNHYDTDTTHTKLLRYIYIVPLIKLLVIS